MHFSYKHVPRLDPVWEVHNLAYNPGTCLSSLCRFCTYSNTILRDARDQGSTVQLELAGKGDCATSMHRLAAVLQHLDVAHATAATADAYMYGTTKHQVDLELRAGVIGLDSDAGVTLAKLLQGSDCRVVAAYDRGVYPRVSSVHSSIPHGMHGTIRSVVEHVPQNVREMEALGVPLADTISELLEQVDVVFLMTKDGRPRLEQAAEVLRARKPLFMDRPLASNLADALVIVTLAEGLGVPCCSASPLRYTDGCRIVRSGSLGTVVHADTYSPAAIDQEAMDTGHLELCWDGAHGIDILIAAMGAGCTSVTYREPSEGSSGVYEGLWTQREGQAGPRTGTYRDLGQYGGKVVTEEGRAHSLLDGNASGKTSPADFWEPLLQDVVRWFRDVVTGTEVTEPSELPSTHETLDVYSFIAAAEESKARGDGAAVSLEEVLMPARKAAQVVLDREWNTPGTLRALGGGKLGSPPFLAEVTDEEAAMLTGMSIIDHRAEKVSDEVATAAISESGAELSWFGESAAGFGEGPQWWQDSVKKPPPVVESEEQDDEQEEQVVEEQVVEDE